MKKAFFTAKEKVALQEAAMPTIQKADDVIIKVARACVCGSDLWNYRGINQITPGQENSGHEALGVVTEVGSEITAVKPGDVVIAPFTHGCGHCRACQAGFDGVCMDHEDTLAVATRLNTFAFNMVNGL